MPQDFAERATEFHVKNGVDKRVVETVDVAKPDEEGEQQRVEVTHWTEVEQVVADTDGVDDVDRKER